ncbi:hypothetical protein [Fodinibius halophilus]|uniref:Uncharacterized protein n=1 Tax=Fodinibius halophilus TaxID=1736908 RepID=A0A6M1TAZ0_9BACT|nr:hypothetical protein [Fodinibius halophilus]NGP87502.1 hypothetical protein [Fodinibius halophilus]
MIRFITRTIFKNKALWSWPAIVLLFVLAIMYWGDIAAAQNSYSFSVQVGDLNLSAAMVMSQIIGLITLVCIIGFPNHFSQNLKSERSSLILSKPISRSDFFFSDLAAVSIVAVAYTLITLLLLAIMLAIKAAIFPFQFFLGILLFLPLLILTYYITIVLFLTITNSYLAGAILGWFITSLSAGLLKIEKLIDLFGIESELFRYFMVALSYIIPSAGGVEELLKQIYSGGFSALDGGLLAFILVSCLPLGLLSLYIFRKKEF